MVTLLYRTLQSTLGHCTVIRRLWVMAAGIKCKTAAKPLKTWLLFTSCRNSRHRSIQRYHRQPLRRTISPQYMRYKQQSTDEQTDDITVGQKHDRDVRRQFVSGWSDDVGR